MIEVERRIHAKLDRLLVEADNLSRGCREVSATLRSTTRVLAATYVAAYGGAGFIAVACWTLW